ncbi:MAG: response regulator [Elusimicrobiota bacterium]|nr:response regulator [Elusimicrobiota bacterium]
MVTEKTYTTFDISKICGVYPTTVANWVDRGELKASVTPGGHRRVNAIELKTFLVSHRMAVPKELSDSDEVKILVVDDDKVVLDSIVKILDYTKKYTIFTAKDGFQAGTSVIEHDPALIIMDIMLPGMDGFEVCKTVRKKNKCVKIIAVTGYNTEETKDKIIKCGADAFLSKPFGMKELLDKVDGLLKKNEEGKSEMESRKLKGCSTRGGKKQRVVRRKKYVKKK